MDDQHSAVAALGDRRRGAGVPVLLWGAPGTGKTSAVRALADAAGWPCETVIASIREPSDFAGLPCVRRRRAVRLRARRVGPAPGRGRPRAAVLRRDLHRTAGGAGRAAAGGPRAGGRRPDRCPTASRSSPPPTRPSRPPTAGTCRRRWPTASATSTGPSTPGRFAEGFAGGWRPPTVPDLAAELGGRDRARPAAGWPAFVTRPAAAGARASPTTRRRAAGRWPSPRTLGDGRPAAGRGRAQPGPTQLVRLAARPRRGRRRRRAWSSSPGSAEADLPDPEAVLADPDALPAARARRPGVRRAVARSRRRWRRTPRPSGGSRPGGSSVAAGQRAPDAAATAARTLAPCRPAGAPVPPEVAAFAPLLRDAQLLS